MSIDYQDSLVAYIDILGFSDLVKESEKDSGIVQTLFDMTNELNYKQTSGIRCVSGFSDGIVISYPPNTDIISFPNSLTFLLLDIEMIQFIIFKLGYLSRGAICKGKLFHSTTEGKHIMFGPAFIKAYELEKSLAFYPRVILDKSISNMSTHYRLTCDNDGIYYVDYLPSLCQHYGPSQLVDKIKQNIHKLKENPRAASKWQWLLSYFERSVGQGLNFQ